MFIRKEVITSKDIEHFRNTINFDLPYTKNLLMEYKGADLWNVVCSAMDWVETSANWLKHRNGPEVHGDPFCDSMNLMFYISAVDMLYEGAAQLYRVFYGILCDKRTAVLMEGTKGIFLTSVIVRMMWDFSSKSEQFMENIQLI